MPIDEERFFRSSDFRSHGHEYEEEAKRMKEALDRRWRVISREYDEEMRFSASLPPKATLWDEVKAYMAWKDEQERAQQAPGPFTPPPSAS